MSDLKKRLAKMPPSKRREALESLPTYLAEASEGERLHSLLTNFDFIDAKLSALAPQPLIADYDLALKSDLPTSDNGLQRKVDCLKLIQDALRLSAHILEQDKTQLAGQLLGRLLSFFEAQEIQGILEEAKRGCIAVLCCSPRWSNFCGRRGIRTITFPSIRGSVMQFNTGMRFSTPARINAIALTPQSPQNPEAPVNHERIAIAFSQFHSISKTRSHHP